MIFFSKTKKINQKGFTLIEGLVAVAVFAIIVIGVYQTYQKAMELVKISRLKVTAVALANEQFEIIRNMSYSDIGISGGVPVGNIERNKTITRDNSKFEVVTTIRNIDDPFDGTIGGIPNDLAPADYKLVAIDISCPKCKKFSPLSFTSYIGPLSLEMSSNNGALFIQVFDANGLPIQGANVHIENNAEIPAIIIDDTTNNNGMLQIVDTPPGAGVYEITVTKEGYSEVKTYLAGDPPNPNPEKPHSTVAIQQLTQISFAIDELSNLNISSVGKTCSPVSNVDFSLQSSKIIGTTPNIYKYIENLTTNVVGEKEISEIEWDTYSITLTDPGYSLIGTIPLLPIILNPDMTQDFKLIVAAKQPNSLLVTIKDTATGLPLSGAEVTLDNGGAYSETLITGWGFLSQTDWSGGAGQTDYIDLTKYFDSDGNIEIASPTGEIKLKEILGSYETSGNLISSTFDTGSVSDFHQVLWQPQAQPPEAGVNSVKMQIATNNDQSTWDFRGPDGSTSTYYMLSGENLNSVHNGDRYLRYKLYLETASSSFTSLVSDVQFTFTSSCVPPGQVIFTSINLDNYTITASRTAYQLYTGTTTLSSAWEQYEVMLNP